MIGGKCIGELDAGGLIKLLLAPKTEKVRIAVIVAFVGAMIMVESGGVAVLAAVISLSRDC